MKCLGPKAKDADLRLQSGRVHQEGVVIATCRVARLTLQTRKLRLVGVATDRHARYILTCPNVKNVKKQMNRNASKKETAKNEKNGKNFF